MTSRSAWGILSLPPLGFARGESPAGEATLSSPKGRRAAHETAGGVEDCTVNAIYGPEQLRLDLQIEYDPETQGYGAWSDRLAVATSAPTVGHAKEMLLDALLQAAEFALKHRHSLRGELVGHVTAGEVLTSLSEQELREFIDAHVHIRTGDHGAA